MRTDAFDPAGVIPNMATGGGNTFRAQATQAGSVIVRGPFRAATVNMHAVGQTGAGFALDNADSNVAGDITVHSGVLYLGAGGPLGDTGAIPVAAERHAGNLTARLTSTSGNVADRVANNVILANLTRAEMGLQTPAGFDPATQRLNVTQPFTHSFVPATYRDARIDLAIASTLGPAVWNVDVGTDVTNYAAGDNTARVQVSSNFVGHAYVDLTVSFITVAFPQVLAGDYDTFVLGTVSENP